MQHQLNNPPPGVVAGSVPDDPPCDPVTGLFLDVDGTLLEIAPTPDEAHATAATLELLEELRAVLGGALALISGRSMADLDRLFAPLQLPMAGIHGSERRSADGQIHRATPITRARLDPARQALAQFVARRAGLLLEDKGTALALHYRRSPAAGEAARVVVGQLMAELHADYELLEGDCVLEIKPVAHNKASAVEAFMQELPFARTLPAFVGDDITDFDGFAAVRRYRGIDIAVGERVAARWSLSTPAAVHEWLWKLVRKRRDRQ